MKYDNIIMEIGKNEYISLKNDANNIKQNVDQKIKLSKGKKQLLHKNKKKTSAVLTKELAVAVSKLYTFYVNNIKSNEQHINSFMDVLRFSMILYKHLDHSKSDIFNLIDNKRTLESKLYKYNKPHLSVFATQQEFIEFKNKKEDLTNELDNVNLEIEKIITNMTGDIFSTYNKFIENGNVNDFKSNIILLSYIINSLKNNEFNVNYSRILKEDFFINEYDKIMTGLNPSFNIEKFKDKTDLEKIDMILKELFNEKTNLLSTISLILFSKAVYDFKLDYKFINLDKDTTKILTKEFKKLTFDIQSKFNDYDDIDSLIQDGKFNKYKYQSSYLDININEDIVDLRLTKNQFLSIVKSLEFVDSLQNLNDIEKLSKLNILNGLNDMQRKLDGKYENYNNVGINGAITDVSKRYNFISNIKTQLDPSEIVIIDNILKTIYEKENNEPLLEMFDELIHFEYEDYIEHIILACNTMFEKDSITEDYIEKLRTISVLQKILTNVGSITNITDVFEIHLTTIKNIKGNKDLPDIVSSNILDYIVLFEIKIKKLEESLKLIANENYIKNSNIVELGKKVINDYIYKIENALSENRSV